MPLTRERPRTPAFLPPPAPLPSLSDALARRAEVFGPFDLDEVPAASRSSLPPQCAGYVSIADAGRPQGGRLVLDGGRPDSSSDYGGVLRQHHLGGGLRRSLSALGRVAAVVCHGRLPGSSWSA